MTDLLARYKQNINPSNKCRHQIRFTCTHRKAKQIIRIGNTIKRITKEFIIINFRWIFLYLFFQFFRYLFNFIISQSANFSL